MIANEDGTETTLDKTVEVEKKPDFSLEATPDCEAKEVELSLISDAAYDASQITATANGKPISIADSKAKAEFTEDTEFEVTVAGEVCAAVTKTATAEYDCEEKDCEAPICSAVKSRVVCSGGDTTEIRVRVDNDVYIDGFYFQFTQDEVCATCTPNWSEPQKFVYRYDSKLSSPSYYHYWILKIPYTKVGTYRWYAISGDCKSEEYILEVPEIMESPVLKPIDDFIFCWNDSELEQKMEDAVLELELESGSVQADGFYFDHFNWYTGYDFDYYTPYDDINGGSYNILKSYKAEPGTTFSKRSINVNQFLDDSHYFQHLGAQDDPIYIRTYATLRHCRSNPIMFLIFNESKPSFSISAKDDEICPGESTVLNLKKYGKTQEFINYKTYTITDDHGNEYEDAPSIEVSPTEKTVYTVTASGKYCTEPVSKEVTVDIDPACVKTEFSLELDKEAICEGGDVELTLVASGEYDATKVTATANGEPIALADGKYTSALSETTKFEVVIANEDGTETTLDKTVEVEKKPDFSLEATPDCEAKEVELSLVSDATYEQSQITATANGKPISFADNKATVEFTEDTEFEVTVAGEVCAAVTKTATAEYDCTESEFSLELDKEAICEGSDVELTLVASGEYDATKVTATANGKPIALTDGKYTATITETTKFGVAIENADGTKTTLEKTVEVESPATFSLDVATDCENKEVELSIISDERYDASQITATANGKPISFADSKAKAEFTEDTEFEVTVAGEVCPAVTKNATAVFDCEENNCEAPVIKPMEDLVFCYSEKPEFMVELAGDVKADKLEVYDHLPSLGGTKIDEIESEEPAGAFVVGSPDDMTAMELVDKGYELSVVAVSGKCKSEPVMINLNYEVLPSFSISAEKDVVCEGEPTILEIEKNRTYNAVSNHTYTVKGDDGSTYEDKAPIRIAPTKMTVYTVTAVGQHCKEPVSKTVAIDIDPYCEDPVFTLKANKTHICVTDEAELSLEATGPYGESWITATANGRPITFTDGKYAATLTETTKFEVIINRPSGNVTKLEKTVEIESKPEFTLDYDTDCDTKSVELSIVSEQSYAPSQISATANGQRIAMVDGRYRSRISGETKFEVTVEGNNCPASTSTAFVSLENCDQENCPAPPVIKPIADMSFCDEASPRFSVELKKEKADRIEVTSPALADKIVVESAEPTNKFDVSVPSMAAKEFAGSEIKVVASNGECVSAPVKFRIRHDAEPSVSLSDAVACEGSVARMTVSAAARYQYEWTGGDDSDDVLSRSQIYSTIASESRHVSVKVTNGSCDLSLDADLKVVPKPFIDEILLDGETNEIVVFAKGGSGGYVYDFGYGDQEESVLTDISYGRRYKIKVTDESGCQADSIFYTGIYDIVIPPFFTPNGDGDNDVWRLENIEKYPSAIITIYHRSGKVIAKCTGADYKPWDGTYNGYPMITDDYWYVIDISIIDKSYTGHFTLLRD